jgi:hypothetical protein
MVQDISRVDPGRAGRVAPVPEVPAGGGFVFGRDLGPAGRLFRLGFVLIAIVSLSSRIGRQLDGDGIAQMLLYFALITVAYLGLFSALNRWVFPRVSPWTGAALLQAPMIIYPMKVGSAPFHNSLAVYTTLSALLCVLIGYGGLEVAAPAALILKRRAVLYSPFNTVDIVERAFRARRNGRGVLWLLSLAVSVVCVVDLWYAPLALTIPAVDRNVDHAIRLPDFWALLLVVPAVYFGVRAWRSRVAEGRRSTTGRLSAMAAGCLALLALIFLGRQVPDHTLWGLILLVGIVVGVVQLVRRRPRASQHSPSPSR